MHIETAGSDRCTIEVEMRLTLLATLPPHNQIATSKDIKKEADHVVVKGDNPPSWRTGTSNDSGYNPAT